MKAKKSSLPGDNSGNTIITESVEMLRRAGYDDCYIAQLTGVAISVPFLLVLILVTMELSIASPGTTSAWAIVFATLAMPTSCVGLFSVYRLLTENFGAGCTEAYSMLEEVEAAYKLGGIKEDAGPSAEAEPAA